MTFQPSVLNDQWLIIKYGSSTSQMANDQHTFDTLQ